MSDMSGSTSANDAVASVIYDPEEAPIPAGGLLFVGDPHLTSRRPTRRKDAKFADAVLKKLAKCIEVANDERLVPILTGDLFHYAVESDESIKTRVLNLFAECWTPPISNVGNHDTKGARLAPSDSLAVIAASGRIKVVAFGGPAARFDLGGMIVGVGCTPSGQTIPTDVREAFGSGPVSEIIWVTHHDVAFDGTYPGAIEPFPVLGCALVINGHQHLPKPAVQAQDTTWFNIGNITRTAIDAINHEPAAWRFTVDAGMSIVPLPFERDVFDLTGRFVDEVAAHGGETADSAFVDLLLEDVESGIGAASMDGGLLLEEIKARFEREKTPPAVRAVILSLFKRSAEVADAGMLDSIAS